MSAAGGDLFIMKRDVYNVFYLLFVETESSFFL